MGKVGSSSIEASLEHLNIPSMHLHSFKDHEEFLIYRNRKDVKCFFKPMERMAYRMVLMQRYRMLKRKDKLKIITLVRDPVATLVSRFFQDLHIQFIEAKKNESLHQSTEKTLEHLISAFENNINHEYFYNWFEAELNANFAVDIFDSQPDPEQQFFRLEGGKVDTLILKCEYLNQNQSSLAGFLQCEGFKLINSNESAEKWYSELYQKFKAIYPFEKLFYLYDTPLYSTLYSAKEIAGFRKYWSTLA
ncbi:putative capsular polysaccharide synthesis family protein [Amphritea sp. HPY]|uniref:putative capsular polysaccharide synthesis family protein n=1 Tax=Amphritea sp. HPY TaxID=3421652 RepID=UPI003D7DDA86